MGVKFAGSRSIDERRRRRLAGESDNPSPSAAPAAHKTRFWKTQRAGEEVEQSPVSPLASMLPPSRWRIWILCTAVPLVGLLLVLLSQQRYLISDQRLQVVFDLEQGHLWRFVRGVLFLGAAGLCWLISWFRSASDRDFEGCYKSWYFSSWIFLLFGFVAGCDGHLLFAQIVGDYTQLQQPLLGTLFWAVPMAALMIEPMRCFTLEMWHCRRSCLMLALCSVSVLTYLEMVIPASNEPEIFTAESSRMIAMGASVLAPAFLFSALLSQMYYVMYVSSDPVCKRRSWTGIALLWLVRKTISGLKIAGNQTASSVRKIVSSTQSRLENRGEGSKKSRTERRNERRLARQKKAEEKALRKQAAREEKEAIAREKMLAREEAKAKKEQAKARKREEAKKRKENSAPSEQKVEKQSSKTGRTEQKQTPFKQIAADQHDKKEPVAAEQTENSRSSNKPRVRLKSKISANSQQVRQPVEEADPSLQHNEKSKKTPETKAASRGTDRIDPSNLKGLSKKERRRIRKLHREQQRANARKAG